MTETLLSVQGLSAGYNDLRALWDVDLDLHAGRVTVVLGRNGAGKTTLLSTIAGLVAPLEGHIRFRGHDITRTKPHDRTGQGIALVQENKRIFRRRTVEQNLVLGGHTLPRRELAGAIEKAYARFPILGEKRALLAGGLSGGQQQMLGIAQALMPNPALLMLDVPSAGLAPVIAQEVFEAVATLRDTGIGILLVEQLVEQSLGVADDVVLLEHGRVQLMEQHADQRERVKEAYLGRGATPT